ncbi:discoidin domain-containing protein [Tamlana agarivorans]|uniref:Discoidin domain-containing protein n=1 Tax=Pseudotamlana agarivorans TaxID=481183 RepID=A0ACC5UAW6_9FLAO|nr:discoidin domain-containing protein [Tamlana agarivorans]MBU2951462.1 discoidin domain-containing protein [Tamlana agarivorans]
MKTKFLQTMLFITCVLMQVNITNAQDPGDRAQKLRGTWWANLPPELFDERITSLKTLDGFQVSFNSGASQSALHSAPCPLLSGLDGADAVFPADNDTKTMDQISIIRDAGFMVKAYSNAEHFVGDNSAEFEEFVASFKAWCDTNPTAQAFINSESYHTKSGYPNRPYMFCYAEFVLKYYSQQYGQYIDAWIFDDAEGNMEENGDDATSGNIDDQRIYEAFANAVRSGNDDIPVAFNNGRSTSNHNSYPFAAATRFDDFTFGHAFGGNNNHAEKITGNQFNNNYKHVTRMTETNGYVHEGGTWTWDDKIVGNYHSKLSTTAWKYGPTQAWEQDDFNTWNEEALSAGGMMTWGGSYNRTETTIYAWVYDLLQGCDDYLFERGISINSENNGNDNGQVGNGNNLALSGTATQSSTYSSGAASLAIDGNTNGAWRGGSVTHTETEDNAWWDLVLDSESSIEEIVIHNRTDCCEDRLSDFIVFMWDEAGNRTLRKFYTTAPDSSLSINVGGLAGYRIRIKSNLAATALSLAEVEVYGTRNLALNGIATQSSTANGGAASRAIDGNTNGAWSAGSVTHTSAEDGAWWALDLGADYNIGEIKIYNRTDACCTERLSNFTMFMWDSNGNRTIRKVINTTPDPYITIDAGGVLGKSIRINSNLTGTALSLAEVEVYNASSSSTAKAADGKIGASNAAVSTSLKVYPNPVHNVFTVQTPDDTSENTAYSVCNHLGQVVLKGRFKGDSTQIDASALKAGMYFLRVSSGEKTYTKKIVKQ